MDRKLYARSAQRFKRGRSIGMTSAFWTVAQRPTRLPGPWIAAFQIGDEASDLHHALFMQPRKPLLEAFFNASERGRPKDHPSEDQEWRSDRARQQQPPDPADNEKDAELFGYALGRRVRLAIVRGPPRAS